MATKLKIKVTKDVLKKSARCGCDWATPTSHNCAVALAAKDIFPYAAVSTYAIVPYSGINDYSNAMQLPNHVSNFIRKFDRSSPREREMMDEIEFEIEVPDAVIERISIDEIRPLLQNHPTLELINA